MKKIMIASLIFCALSVALAIKEYRHLEEVRGRTEETPIRDLAPSEACAEFLRTIEDVPATAILEDIETSRPTQDRDVWQLDGTVERVPFSCVMEHMGGGRWLPLSILMGVSKRE